MKRILTLLTVFCSLVLSAQTINYKGVEVELGPHAFLVDANAAIESPYVFKSFNEAAARLTDGTAAEPMKVYIAPWVYWIDDPDDPQVRVPAQGTGSPIGLTIRCEHLQLLGLSDNPKDVVLASARGQSQGAIGNFTMFDFYGSDMVVKDLTMGNYCNIDLVYPHNPSLNRAKRGPAITQAQLAFSHGDRIYVENVRFEARLNLCPISGMGRTLYVGCHFESTDDSLNGTAVYLGCDADFYGRQPFGGVGRSGSIWLDCDLYTKHGDSVQALSKTVGRHSIVDVRYHAGRPIQLAWTFRPEEWLRCYQSNVTLDGAPVFVGASKAYNTVILDKTAQLAAFKLIRDDGSILYNTYNLLRGDDDWDPQGIKDEVLALGKRDGRDYANIPICLDINRRAANISTGGEGATLKASLNRLGSGELHNQMVRWKVQPGYERYASLSCTEGPVCTVTATNHADQTQTFDIFAYTDEGLEGAVAFTVSPDMVPAPAFTRQPAVKVSGDKAVVDYALDLQGRRDESIVTWYRCDDRKGGGAVPVAVSRGGKPLLEYRLQPGDNGKYLAAGVSPKHLRCEPGKEVTAISRGKVRVPDVKVSLLETDFSDFPTANQTEVRPGYWTVDAFKPADTRDYTWKPDLSQPCWTYGYGINGASHNPGLQQLQQGARLRYTPPSGKYGDMSVTWRIDPAKDGGQGFASARMQYLDCFIKFDNEALTGYALRAIRTTKYANAVDVLLVRYDKGEVSAVSEPVTVDCFLTGCVLQVWTEGNLLKAHVEGPKHIKELSSDPAVHGSADLQAQISPDHNGGFGLQHTSTVGTESRISVISVKAEWK